MATAEEENPPDVGKKVMLSAREGDTVLPEVTMTPQDHLITEIESADGHLCSTLRAVYDGDDGLSREESSDHFMERLDTRIKGHDKEIERMCNYHYQGFIESINGLLQVRSDVETLKTDIQTTNQNLQVSGKNLMSKAEELIKARKVQRNIATAVETLTLCLPVLEIYGKLREQMRAKRYYPALKTLEQLEHSYLPRVSKYRFSQVMCETIPKLRENIKEASMSDLKDFLENIRKHSEKIGEVAMKHAAEQNNLDPTIALKRGRKRRAPAPPKRIGATNGHAEMGSKLTGDETDSTNPFGDEFEEDDLNPFAGDSTNPFGEDEDSTNPFGSPGGSKKKVPPPRPPPPKLDDDDDDDVSLLDDTEGLSAQDLVDFSPVYRCLHIYSVLGAREAFESYYRKQRKKQARLALQPPPNMSQRTMEEVALKAGESKIFLPIKEIDLPGQERARRIVERHGGDQNAEESEEEEELSPEDSHETLEGYKKYFHEIIGFFVVEDHILTTSRGLVNRSYMDQLWDMALNKIVAALRIHTTFCTDPSLMLQIKNLIMLFCLTLRGYGFPVSQLYDLLLEIRDQYSEILMKKWVAVFNKIFDEDNYTPIHVETESGYAAVTDVYPFRLSELEQQPFPKCFPFSQFVPKIYSQVKEYIYACLKFSEDLNLSQTEIDDMIRKLANVLLTRTLGGCLSALIKRPSLTLLQLIQISINMNYLEKSCTYLEDFISNITNAEKANVHISKLQGTSMFKDARHEAEEQIYRQLNEKIDEFLELAAYDWLMPESVGSASDYILELIQFLQTIFATFTNLPEKVAQTACMLACKHIAKCMMDLLLDQEVKSMSMGALMQFNLDLLQCELFASSEPVPGFNDGTLALAFADLRQLINLFMDWDWSTYLADYGKDTSKYLRANPHTCIILLEKLKECNKKKNNLLTSFTRNERDKKKLMETVLRQLRQLVNGQMNSQPFLS